MKSQKKSKVSVFAFIPLVLIAGLTLHCHYLPVPSAGNLEEKAKPVKKVPPLWAKRLNQRLAKLAEKTDGNLGVSVLDIESQVAAGYQQNRRWYLASVVKVPIAIEVLNQIERKKLSWDQQIEFQLSMALDGAGATNHSEPGQKRSLRFLVEEMLLESDNTAADILIGLVGIESVNATLKSLVPSGFGPITSLLDVRRLAYAEIHPGAKNLTGLQFLDIRKKDNYPARYRHFTKLVQAKPQQLHQPDVRSAFEAFYAKGYNSGTLESFSQLLALIARNEALSPFVSKELTAIMKRCQTGATRLKKGFPPGLEFAHKTGTQLLRICDMGFLELNSGRKVAISACVEKFKDMKAAESALARVGATVFSEMNQDSKIVRR